MKKISLMFAILSLVLFSHVVYANESNNDETKKSCVPVVMNPLKDYTIIATNVAQIQTAKAFRGGQLRYSQTSQPNNKKNKVRINSRTGELSIKAEHKDNFDVSVKAQNQCGFASSKFNVQIDEEI